MDLVKNKVFGIVGVFVILVSLFLPYIDIYVWGFKAAISNGFTPWEGKIVLFLLVVIIIFLFKDYIQKALPKFYESNFGKTIKKAGPKYILIPAGMIAALMIIMALRLWGDTYKLAIGYYVTWGGVALLVVNAFLDKSGNNNNQINAQPMMNNDQMNAQPMMNND